MNGLYCQSPLFLIYIFFRLLAIQDLIRPSPFSISWDITSHDLQHKACPDVEQRANMHFLNSVLAAAVAITSVADAGKLQYRAAKQLTQVTAFNSGPTAAKMYIYVPDKKVTPAPIIVAIHYCTGTGPGYFSGSQYATLADSKGFIVIYPSSPSSGGCWDVASTASLTHNGGGDSKTIVNMVDWAVTNYGGDKDRVYVTGSSSGAMMTQLLAGAYPDVFKAGSSYSGVPDGCFYVAGATAGMSTPGWANACVQGQLSKTAQQWGDLTRSYYPGYNGTRPKLLM